MNNNNHLAALCNHRYFKHGYFWVILLAVFAYILWGYTPRHGTVTLKYYLAVFSVGLVIAYSIFKICIKDFSLNWVFSGHDKPHLLGKLFYVLAFSACFFGILNYYSFNKKQFTGIGDYYDITYYYLNSKYFEELGYKNIYDALLVADKEGNNRFKHIKNYRELVNYGLVSTQHAFNRTAEIKAKFSNKRWQEFVSDVRFLTRQPISSTWQYFFYDHGFNGTPAWAVVGKMFSGNIPIQNAKWFTSVDILLMVLMFVVVVRALGWEAAIFAMLFYTCTLSSNWPKLGQALLRFDWVAALGLCMAAYHRKFYATAGACLAYAAMIRVFPAIFFFPFAVDVVRQFWQHRCLKPEQMRFIGGAFVITTTIMISALVMLGPQSFIEAKEKIGMHAGPDSYSSQRIGLGDAMVFHGERTRSEMNMNGGTLGKGEEIRKRLPYLYFIGFLGLVFIVLVMVKQDLPPHYTMPLCVMMLFILTTPSMNYFNFRILLFLGHIILFHRYRSSLGLVMLFAIEAYAQYADQSNLRYFVTSCTSVGLSIYFTFIIGSYLSEIYAKSKWVRGMSSAKAGVVFSVGFTLLMLMLAGPQYYYRYHESLLPEPLQVSANALVGVKPSGHSWNGPGCIVLHKGGAAISYGRLMSGNGFSVSFDNNDDYSVEFYLEGDRIGSQVVSSRRIRMRGLAVYEESIPQHVRESGFDTVHVMPISGDGKYSIGHFVLR